MNIYIIRHGETELNNLKVYYGSTDCSINHNGVKYCNKMADFFSTKNIDKIITSSLLRTKQSADIINKYINAEVFEIKGLNEIDFGLWENKSYEQISSEYPQSCKEWCYNWNTFRFPEGESFFEFKNRVIESLSYILHCDGQNVLIVCHNGVMKVILCHILFKTDDWFWKFNIKNNYALLLNYENRRFSKLKYIKAFSL